MLDVHPPHHTPSTWRDFLFHIATIVVGLLIAVGLEQTVEYLHRRHQVHAAREALAREHEDNLARFAKNVSSFRKESAFIENNLVVLKYLQAHPGTPQSRLPGVLVSSQHNAGVADAVWKSIQAVGVTAYMPQEEVQRTTTLYVFLNQANEASEEEWQACLAASSFEMVDRDPANLTPTQIAAVLALTQAHMMRHFNHGVALENLGEEFPEFSPAPSFVELKQLSNTPVEHTPEYEAALAITRERIAATATRIAAIKL